MSAVISSSYPAAYTAVAGNSSRDLWIVGARERGKPTIKRWDGAAWSTYTLDHPEVDLWWVHVMGQEVFVSGSDGAIFRLRGQSFERMKTPGLARHTVFGIWGRSADELYAVGGIGARSGFIWRFDGSQWSSLPLPAAMPKQPNGATAGLFKVWGDDQGTVWFVGHAGSILRLDPGKALRVIPTPTKAPLFTVAGDAGLRFAVGGSSQGVILDLSHEPPKLYEPPNTGPLQGLSVAAGRAIAVGARGEAWELRDERWEPLALTPPQLTPDSLHAAWIDPQGGIWSVGGGLLSASLDRGVVVYRGEAPPAMIEAPPPLTPPTPPPCPEELVQRGKSRSLARRWNEQILGAIRRDLPQPGVHARNLYHLSAAMFDAWAATQPQGVAHIAQERLEGATPAQRDAAISHAAYTVLKHRYSEQLALGHEQTQTCLIALMRELQLDPNDVRTQGQDAVAIGNRIGERIIAFGREDGALEAQRYIDVQYTPPNLPLSVDEPDIYVDDPTRWQPLDLSVAISQNGIPLGSGEQGYIGPHWGNVRPFALTRPAPQAPYFETSPSLALGPDLQQAALEVIRRTAWLDSQDSTVIDISPSARGNAPLGEDVGQGHPVNPVTGRPYPPQRVRRSDFGRVLAEFWADGPNSETPPGHWNTIANEVLAHPMAIKKFEGMTQDIDPLELDLRLYLVLNGALHDAAIAAWELKRRYESARPITLIRWMSQQGQSSDPDGPRYHPDGLPLVPGLIEIITSASSAPGQRHEHLAAYVNELAIFTWPGAPADHKQQSSSCQWTRGVEWSPYQPRTFVSPAFPGYVSGHSTFSRAAAQVLTTLTGSPYFPGGLGQYIAPKDKQLKFERGPTQDVMLEWATYFDAADQAGQSRLWGGIHILPDDLDGRAIGDQVARRVLDKARQDLLIP